MKQNPRVLSLLALAIFLNQGEAATFPNLFNSIAGYWQFDETIGGIAHEASGQGLNGTLINYAGNQGTWTGGKIGGALDFGGLAAQQYVRVPNFTKPTTSLTLSAWIWADSFPQWATVAANWNGVYGALNYGMFGSDPRLSFYFAEPNPQGINVANGAESIPPIPGGQLPPLTLGTWHHIAVVVSGGNASPFNNRVTFWRDGQTMGSFTFSGSFYPAPVPHLDIGGEPTYNNPNQGYWDGKIDDLALWTRALSGQELGAIYNAGLNGESLLTLVPEPATGGFAVIGLLANFAMSDRAKRRKSA